MKPVRLSKKTKTDTVHGAIGGFFLAGAIWCLAQDWMGLEGWIAYERAHWADRPWWLWAIMIGVILVLLFMQRKVERERDDLLDKFAMIWNDPDKTSAWLVTKIDPTNVKPPENRVVQ